MSKLIIRTATKNDLDYVTAIEATCFPAAEAAKRDIIKERLQAYSKGFFIGEVDGEIVGFINGGAFDAETIKDEFFEDMNLHKDTNPALVIFGLDVHPEHQKKGYAAELMNHFIEFAKIDGKDRVLLTCKEHLIHYYGKFGYINHGVSESIHGGAKWYDMTLKL